MACGPVEKYLDTMLFLHKYTGEFSCTLQSLLLREKLRGLDCYLKPRNSQSIWLNTLSSLVEGDKFDLLIRPKLKEIKKEYLSQLAVLKKGNKI